MNKALFLVLGLLLVLNAAAGLAGVTHAQSGDGYDLSWSSVDGGAGSLAGGDYALTGLAGQSDTAPALSGGDYTLVGGFWPGAEGGTGGEYRVYLPLAVRNH